MRAVPATFSCDGRHAWHRGLACDRARARVCLACAGLMLFELFPRFWESIKEQDKEGNAARSQLTEKTTLKDILAANDLEVHLFAEYCR